MDPIAAMAVAEKEKLEALMRGVQTESEAVAGMITRLAEENGIVPVGDAKPALAEGTEEMLLDDDDNPEAEFLAPFPWFGGKSRVAKFVWKALGDVPMFIEPFFGSGACLLGRPLPEGQMRPDGIETVNDMDGLVCNFWRAVKSDPDKVADFADWPVNENDLTARHLWLVGQKDSLAPKLEGDPDYFDAKIAGW